MTRASLRPVALADGTIVDVRITGSGSVPVIPLAGGAAASIDFFPGVRSLQHATVLEHDRVGTGRTAERDSGPATLASAAADLHALRMALGLPPVVVVAQSFGGAVWAQWLQDHPDDIAGAVVLDPTPFNDPKLMNSAPRTTRMINTFMTTPVLRSLFGSLTTHTVRKDADLSHPDTPAALTAILDVSQWSRMAQQYATLPAQCDQLRERLTTHPGHTLIISAERKSRGTHQRIRRAHEDLARRLGARHEEWPGAVHTEHLRQPQQLMEAVQSVIDLVRAR